MKLTFLISTAGNLTGQIVVKEDYNSVDTATGIPAHQITELLGIILVTHKLLGEFCLHMQKFSVELLIVIGIIE